MFNLEISGLESAKVAAGYPMTTGKPIGVKPKSLYKLGAAKPGSGHDSFLKGINVAFDLKMSQAMHRQFLRYHFLDIVSSQSLMHRALSGEHEYNCYVSKWTIEHIQELIWQYNDNKTEENYLRVIYNMPLGVELWCRVTTNYLQLKTIYQQRKNHKLPEWKNFCWHISQLPEFMELTGLGEKE